MNALALACIAFGALAIGYVFYSRLVARWLGLDPKLTPPAVELRDGVDYVPARHWTMIFGHHFASIAGAAPILGPVLACLYWGWLPAVIWIVVGGIFFGAVHDYLALGVSLENKGRSISDLSESVLGKSAKVVFSMFVLLALILIVAVFAAVAGNTLATTPQVVLPTFGLIGVAMVVGFLVYRTRMPLVVASLCGLAMLVGLIVLGYHVPISLNVASPAKWWTVILLLYAVVASVLPVSLLLQPRDHLAAGVLFVGMLLGFLGIALSRPEIQSPALVAFDSAKQGWLWPMMFVVIACGAISGFHSLVASGTTSKQLPHLRDARPVGYGAMIMESALAVLAVIAVTAGLYWEKLPPGVEGYVYQESMAGGEWIRTFGRGYGELTKPIFNILGPTVGFLVGITVLKTFIMTTLDSATRITRYVCAELVGDTFGIKVFKNRYVATVSVVVCAGALALGNWQAIWPVFGSANQLIAAMALIVATAYLMTRGRRWGFAAVPAVLVFVTAMGALIYKLVDFLTVADYMLAAIAAVLVCLGLFVAYQGAARLRATLLARPPRGAPSSGPPEESAVSP